MEIEGILLNTASGNRQFTIDDDTCRSLDTSEKKENYRMIKLFLYSYVSLLSDSPLVSTKGQKPYRLYQEFYSDIIRTGLKPFILKYADLSHTLLSNLRIFGDSTITGEFLYQFKDTPIFKEYLEWYRTADSKLLEYILTFLTFGKKLWYVDESLNSIAFRDWKAVEEKLSDLDLPPNYLLWLRKIMSGLLPSSDLTDLWPKFGPGAVAEKRVRGVVSKSNNLRYDPRLDRAFFRSYFVNFGLNADLGYSPDKFYPGKIPKIDGKHDIAISSLRFVPKTVKTARSICMETNTRMCFQQAYLNVLLHNMDNNVCRRFINFDDQSRNRALAEYGSYTGDIDTIDLSAASDSVHVDLVRGIFPKRVLYFLLATRSSSVDVSSIVAHSQPVKVKKFAPMGSALCFPVQSLIFTSIVILASIVDVFDGCLPIYDENVSAIIDNLDDYVEKHFFRSAGYISPELKRYQPASIYGDDICVDRRLTPYVTSILTSLGFSVNHGKSFTGSQAFRESCGGYYWQGYDITPLYFRIPYHRKPDASVFMSALSLANAAGDRRYLRLRKYLIHYLLKEYRFVRFSNNRQDTCSIYTTSARNSHLRRRYNNDYQRDELLGLAVVPSKKRYPHKREQSAYDSYLYHRWRASRVLGIVPDFVESAPKHDSSGARLVGSWTPD